MRFSARLNREALWLPLGALAVTIATIVASSPAALVDLAPYYCAGVALVHGHDPYLVASATACRATIGHQGAGVAEPPLLPPVWLVPFVATSGLSFFCVAVAFVAAALVAFGYSAWRLAHLAGVPWWIAALALFWHVPLFDIPAGDLSVFALAAIVGCAAAFSRGRAAEAGALAFCATIQPTIGLPLCAIVLVAGTWSARAALLACGASAIVVSLLAGPALTSEYLRVVIPLQAFAEIDNWFQFSATSLAAAFGASPEVALRYGALSYAVTFVVAVACGWVLVRRGQTAAAVFVPCAVVTLGGSYIHVQQLALCLPAGVLLAGRGRGWVRNVAAVATAAFCGEWLSAWSASGATALLALAPRACSAAVVFARLARRDGMRAIWLSSAVAFAAAIAIVTFAPQRMPVARSPFAQTPVNAVVPLRAGIDPNAYLSGPLRAYDERFFGPAPIGSIALFKSVLWLAAFGIGACGVGVCLRPGLLTADTKEPTPFGVGSRSFSG